MRLNRPRTILPGAIVVLFATALVAVSAAGLDDGRLGFHAWPSTQLQEQRDVGLPLAGASQPRPRPRVRRQAASSFAVLPVATPSAPAAPAVAPRSRAQRSPAGASRPARARRERTDAAATTATAVVDGLPPGWEHRRRELEPGPLELPEVDVASPSEPARAGSVPASPEVQPPAAPAPAEPAAPDAEPTAPATEPAAAPAGD